MMDVRVNILSFILKPGPSRVLFVLYLFRHLRRKGGKSSLLIFTQNMDPRASLTSRHRQGLPNLANMSFYFLFLATF